MDSFEVRVCDRITLKFKVRDGHVSFFFFAGALQFNIGLLDCITGLDWITKIYQKGSLLLANKMENEPIDIRMWKHFA